MKDMKGMKVFLFALHRLHGLHGVNPSVTLPSRQMISASSRLMSASISTMSGDVIQSLRLSFPIFQGEIRHPAKFS